MTDFGTQTGAENTVVFPGSAGTFLMRHAKTVHWAGANKSTTRLRSALGFIYYAKSAKLDEAAKEAYQKALDVHLNISDNI